MKYRDYTIEYSSTGNTHIDHVDDIFCRVYLQPKYAPKTEMLNSFIIPGGEIHDYGSAEAAITAYMRRDYPDNDDRDTQDYRKLQEYKKELQQQMKLLIERLLARHGGNITSYPVTNENEGCDYPVTMIFYGRYGTQNINITNVYLDGAGRLKADGIDDHESSITRALEILPEHYAGILAFLAFALGIN